MKTNDINIGDGLSIKWIPFQDEVIPENIDDLLVPTKEFWSYLETECEAECCGLNAFSFTKQSIDFAKDKSKIVNLASVFKKTLDALSLIEDEVIVSSQFNQLINRKVFLQLLEHLIKST